MSAPRTRIPDEERLLTNRNLLVLIIGLLVAVLLIGSARLSSIERKVEDAHNAARSADSSASSAGGSYSFQVEYVRSRFMMGTVAPAPA